MHFKHGGLNSINLAFDKVNLCFEIININSIFIHLAIRYRYLNIPDAIVIPLLFSAHPKSGVFELPPLAPNGNFWMSLRDVELIRAFW